MIESFLVSFFCLLFLFWRYLLSLRSCLMFSMYAQSCSWTLSKHKSSSSISLFPSLYEKLPSSIWLLHSAMTHLIWRHEVFMFSNADVILRGLDVLRCLNRLTFNLSCLVISPWYYSLINGHWRLRAHMVSGWNRTWSVGHQMHEIHVTRKRIVVFLNSGKLQIWHTCLVSLNACKFK